MGLHDMQAINQAIKKGLRAIPPASDLIRKTRRQGHVAMFHVGRSGSTVVSDLLNQHPAIEWKKEIYQRLLEERQVTDPTLSNLDDLDALDYAVEQSEDSFARFFGYEVKFFHLRKLGIDLRSYLDNIENELFNLKYVVLRRQNMLRVIASTAAAHQRGQWFVENSSTPDSEIKRPITIDTNAIPMNRSFFPLMHLLDEAERDFDILDGLMEYRPSLFLTYEDDVRADPTNAYARICDHIGITPMPAQIKRRRTNPEPLSNMIANYNEVSALLRGTSYEWMLTED